MLTGKIMYLISLSLGDIQGILPHDTPSFPVYVQHDLFRLFLIFMKDDHQHFHHELHGGKMIVQQYHPKFFRFLEFFFLSGGKFGTPGM